MLCAVEVVTCGVPGVFVSRQFQRRVQSPMTGANPSNPLDSQHKTETTSTLEIGLVHLCFRSYPGVQARSIGTVVVHAYSPSGICALVSSSRTPLLRRSFTAENSLFMNTPVLAYYPALRFRLSSCIDVRVAQLDNDVVPSIPQHALADDSVDNGRTRRLCLKGGNKLDQSGDALLSVAGVASYSCKGEIPIALRAGHAARSCNMQSEYWLASVKQSCSADKVPNQDRCTEMHMRRQQLLRAACACGGSCWPWPAACCCLCQTRAQRGWERMLAL